MRVLVAVLTLLLAAPAAAQQDTAQVRVLSDSLRVELVRARGFVRGAETQLTKTLAIADRLSALLLSRPTPPDTAPLPPPDTAVPPLPLPDIAAGRVSYRVECMGCHAGAEAYDLAHFQYDDSTIIRRAHPHLADPLLSRNVAAYVRSLASAADTATGRTHVYQPGAPLDSDAAFALALFGADAWPDTLTPAGLRAHNLRTVQIALRLPTWSNEADAYDWLPGDGVRGELPAFAAASPALATYYAQPSIPNAVGAARQVLVRAHQQGPCQYPPSGPADLSLYDPVACFDVAKWGASLIYVEGIRSGDVEAAGRSGASHLWETGHMSHKSQQFGVALPLEDRHTAAWTWMGCVFDACRPHASLYTTEPMSRLGLERHATYIALWLMMRRNPAGTPAQQVLICHDAHDAVEWGYEPWDEGALRFAYGYMQGLINGGWVPPAGCAAEVRGAQQRLAPGVAIRLQPLANSLLSVMQ